MIQHSRHRWRRSSLRRSARRSAHNLLTQQPAPWGARIGAPYPLVQLRHAIGILRQQAQLPGGQVLWSHPCTVLEELVQSLFAQTLAAATTQRHLQRIVLWMYDRLTEVRLTPPRQRIARQVLK